MPDGMGTGGRTLPCTGCSPDYYSASGATSCTKCPEGSSSFGNSSACQCNPGYALSGDTPQTLTCTGAHAGAPLPRALPLQDSVRRVQVLLTGLLAGCGGWGTHPPQNRMLGGHLQLQRPAVPDLRPKHVQQPAVGVMLGVPFQQHQCACVVHVHLLGRLRLHRQRQHAQILCWVVHQRQRRGAQWRHI